jgi:hypothetical protein
MLLFLKPVSVELIMPGICKANVLILLQFHQAFPQLAQHSVCCICLKKDQVERIFFTNSKIVDEAGT